VAEIGSVTYKPIGIQDKRLTIGAVVILALFLYAGLRFPPTLSLVLAFQIVFFFLLFQRPVWALASLIIGQLTTNNFMIPVGGGLVSVRLIWTILALVLLVPVLVKKGGTEFGSRARRIIVPAIIFFFVATISNVANTESSYTLQYLRMIVNWATLLILLPAVVTNEKDLKWLALVVLITGSVSAVFALIQSRGGFLGVPAHALYGIYDASESYYRVSGLSESAVQLGFNLPVIMLPMLAFFFLKGVNWRFRKLIIVLVTIMLVALYYTYTRTGIYALAPGLLVMGILMKGKPKKSLLLVLVLVFAAFLIFVNTQGNRYSQWFGEEGSANGRLVLWQTGIKVAVENPILGIGGNNFREASLAYASIINPNLMKLEGTDDVLGVYQPHNDFISAWASYGTMALLAYLWMFISIFRNFLEAYRNSSTRFLKVLSLGCIGSMVAYIVNAATHNLMETSALIWIFAGLSIAVTKLMLSKRPSEAKEIR
jgi:O-antigen ligase